MIEIGGIKSSIDLLDQLMRMIRQGRQDKREAFDRICKPLFEKLEPIVQEYFAIANDALRDLENGAEVRDVIRGMMKRRANLLIARDRLIGNARAFSELLPRDGANPFESRILAFGASVSALFFEIDQWFNYSEPLTDLQTFRIDLERVEQGNMSKFDAMAAAEERQKALLLRWREISQLYTTLEMLRDAWPQARPWWRFWRT